MILDGMSIYVIHGWKVDGAVMERCLMNLSPAAIELGLRVVFPKGVKYAFLGEILAKTVEGVDFSDLRIVPPVPGAETRLMAALDLFSIKKEEVGSPVFWVLAG